MAEQLAEPVECGQLLWVVENFFTYRGVSHHELGLNFLVTLHSGSRLLNAPGPYVGVEAGAQLTFAWFERSERTGAKLATSFLAMLKLAFLRHYLRLLRPSDRT